MTILDKLEELRKEWIAFPEKRENIEFRAKLLKRALSRFENEDRTFETAKKIFTVPENNAL